MKHMDILRRKIIFELFIDHFIEMARVSIKYRALQQTTILLKQAERICSLLRDDKYQTEVEEYEKTIEKINEIVQNLLKESTIDGPELPRRLSLAEKSVLKSSKNRPKITTKIDEEVTSDDDNDEIYNYHNSVIAQIHATSAENLARFQHTDEIDDDDDEVDEMTKYFDKLETNEEIESIAKL
jgi:hypothetical protein